MILLRLTRHLAQHSGAANLLPEFRTGSLPKRQPAREQPIRKNVQSFQEKRAVIRTRERCGSYAITLFVLVEKSSPVKCAAGGSINYRPGSRESVGGPDGEKQEGQNEVHRAQRSF
jgi:hypothetical protein